MGEIVDLASERGHRSPHHRMLSAHTPSHAPALGPAQVVLYTGVRYERHDTTEPPSPKPPESAAPSSKSKKKPRSKRKPS